MHKSAAAVTLPLLFSACASLTTPKEVPPDARIEFIRANLAASVTGYVNPINGRLQQQVLPPRAVFKDKTTDRYYHFSCAALDMILNAGMIDLVLAKTKPVQTVIRDNLEQLLIGYRVLDCGRNLHA